MRASRRPRITREAVLSVLSQAPGSTVTSVAKRLGADTSPVGNTLSALYRAGKICRVGWDRNAVKYSIAEVQPSTGSTPASGE